MGWEQKDAKETQDIFASQKDSLECNLSTGDNMQDYLAYLKPFIRCPLSPWKLTKNQGKVQKNLVIPLLSSQRKGYNF